MVVKGNKKELDPDVCEGNPDIVIAANYLDRNTACAGVPLLIDKAYLKYNGAVALRFLSSPSSPFTGFGGVGGNNSKLNPLLSPPTLTLPLKGGGNTLIETAKQFRGNRPWVVLWKDKAEKAVSD